MKQVKCVITDDEPTACEGLQRYVEKVDFLSLMGVCEDTMQLNTLLQTEQPDLLFLDIEMPYLSGLELLASLAHPPTESSSSQCSKTKFIERSSFAYAASESLSSFEVCHFASSCLHNGIRSDVSSRYS